MLNRLPADDTVGEDALTEVRCVQVHEDGKRPRLVTQATVPLGNSIRRDYAQIHALLNESEPCVMLVRLKDKKESMPAKDNDWAVIIWIPTGTPMPKQKLFSHSAESIREVMPPNCQLKEINASEKSQLTLNKFMESVTEMTGRKKPLFLDMKHSNNAARIRLWLALKKDIKYSIKTKMMEYAQLKEPEFAEINPLMKVPALVREDTEAVFEAKVILDYLEDKFSEHEPSFKPTTAEDRQLMDLVIRNHDFYVASPNCTAPGFSHSQGAMYLSTEWHGAARGMDLPTRAAKIAELWRQVVWLNSRIVGPYLCGPNITLADLTWFPTTIFMEFMLLRFFGWPDIFRSLKGPTPALAKWWTSISAEPAFKAVRQQIFEYWEDMEKKGQFKPILDEIATDTTGLKFKFP